MPHEHFIVCAGCLLSSVLVSIEATGELVFTAPRVGLALTAPATVWPKALVHIFLLTCIQVHYHFGATERHLGK